VALVISTAMKTATRHFFVFGFGLLATALMSSGQATDALTPPAATAMPAVPATPPKVEKGYLKLSFDYLASFPIALPTGADATDEKVVAKKTDAQIPARVKDFNGKKASITGYMIPVKMEKGLVTEFLLMRNTLACCYGTTPNVNEWVTVKMKKGVPPTMDVPVEFYGELRVKPLIESGYLSAIYQLDGERMGEVKG
jgi:hypothetical protein